MTDPWTEPTGKRTGVVTVLCITIFIFGGIAAWSNFGDWMSPPSEEEVEQVMDQSMEMMHRFSTGNEEAREMEPQMREVMEVYYLNTSRVGLWKFIASLGALIGAIPQECGGAM